MAKTTAWLVTVIGVLMILPLIGIDLLGAQGNAWLMALLVLAIGITKLMRNYGKKRR